MISTYSRKKTYSTKSTQACRHARYHLMPCSFRGYTSFAKSWCSQGAKNSTSTSEGSSKFAIKGDGECWSNHKAQSRLVFSPILQLSLQLPFKLCYLMGSNVGRSTTKKNSTKKHFYLPMQSHCHILVFQKSKQVWDMNAWLSTLARHSMSVQSLEPIHLRWGNPCRSTTFLAAWDRKPPQWQTSRWGLTFCFFAEKVSYGWSGKKEVSWCFYVGTLSVVDAGHHESHVEQAATQRLPPPCTNWSLTTP